MGGVCEGAGSAVEVVRGWWDLLGGGDSVFWDWSTLYAFRGLFFAGETDTCSRYFSYYLRTRLPGEHGRSFRERSPGARDIFIPAPASEGLACGAAWVTELPVLGTGRSYDVSKPYNGRPISNTLSWPKTHAP
ncbi:MAG TPA: hypothetical protein VGN00_10025 [Puia sp.]